MKFNLADVFETVVDAVPERVVLTWEGHDYTYAELDRLANQVAHHFAAHGVGKDDNVALFLKNSVEHVTSLIGLIKVRAVPVNVNYRYTDSELEYIFDNSDSAAIVVELPEHQRSVANLMASLPELRTVFVIGEAVDELTAAAAALDGRTVEIVDFNGYIARSTERDFEKRTGEELYLIYTGGTTGYPKGVMWQHDDFFRKPISGGNPYGPPRADLAELAKEVQNFPSLSFLIAAPLMHGAASYSLFTFISLGGRLILERDFDAAKIVRNIGRDKTQMILIVGDAMGMPLADEMEKQKDTADFSTLFSITSGGALWSQSVRERMLAVKPDLMLRDNFGASESGNDGEIKMDENGNLMVPPTDRMMVVDEKFNKITTPNEVGHIARIGNIPMGYYKDPEKTARTFPTLADGTRISVLGDMGYLREDGSIVFLGRGSQCINTGGEKVYAEEVEGALHAHPAVADALVVPAPDPKYGQRVAAVVSLNEGFDEPSLEEIQEHCRQTLAGYKVPRTVVFVDEVKRTPAGKADYKWAKATAAEEGAAV
ncbi:AMP-binding protein [Gordonia sp. PS3]|uniref:Putative fatty-acid--CoA ligase n=1 Tax=Gordonia sihwensis NBRC 108236 TaxID=1223544 RepID=L7LMC1_9ACTN|nr:MULTISPECIES: AMP-binding protein [Gordonia]AUH68026.1 acyl-CoA synthetase [Gordonia sp. YC-JH1]MBY4569334.1 acyl-CoA synthetase [Gordonia sihwensis]WFN92246.1 AMP-binding protein [Gordonia sihwensis]GAC61886.1 putative fatty-acid--CoA ligase [Gordonia sihwensis NBRC 108236]